MPYLAAVRPAAMTGERELSRRVIILSVSFTLISLLSIISGSAIMPAAASFKYSARFLPDEFSMFLIVFYLVFF
jgi:hypothetical protein